MKGELIIVGALSLVAYVAGREYAGEWEYGVLLSLAAIGLSVTVVFVLNLLAAPLRIYDEQEVKINSLQQLGRGMPLLVLDFDFEQDESHYRWFRLRNLGPGIALDITIDPVELGPTKLTFDPTVALEAGEARAIGGRIEDKCNPNQRPSRFATYFYESLCKGRTLGTTVETPLTIRFKNEHGFPGNSGLVVLCDDTGELSIRKAASSTQPTLQT